MTRPRDTQHPKSPKISSKLLLVVQEQVNSDQVIY